MKGILIIPGGGVAALAPANGSDYTLEELQESVGGNIEIIDISPKVIMVVNEDGKHILPPNGMATVIARVQKAIFPNDYIAGNALMCPSEMVK